MHRNRLSEKKKIADEAREMLMMINIIGNDNCFTQNLCKNWIIA